MKLPRQFTQPVAVGGGSFSTVFRVYQPGIERYAVAKVIPVQAGRRDAAGIEKESHTLASLRLPCVPHIYDVLRYKGQVIILMEWIRGIPLSGLMERQLSPDCAMSVATAVISAVAMVHGTGMAHGDLKPENILLVPDGRVFLVDFGFAIAAHRGVSNHGVIKGTPAYMAPELWSCGEAADPRKADLYALGVILHNLLGKDAPAAVGDLTANDPDRRPPDCTFFERTWRQLRLPPAPADSLAPTIGPAVEEYTARLLLAGARELSGKGRREEAYALLIESLEAWPDNAEALDYLQNKFSTPIRPAGIKRVAVIAAMAAAIVLTGVGSYILGFRSRTRSTPPVDHSWATKGPDDRKLSYIAPPRGPRQSGPPDGAVLRGNQAAMEASGSLAVLPPAVSGSLFIDKAPVVRTGEGRSLIKLPAGLHRVEWRDSSTGRSFGETVSLLPFETKTISFARYDDGK